jgi:hypothetical protein
MLHRRPDATRRIFLGMGEGRVLSSTRYGSPGERSGRPISVWRLRQEALSMDHGFRDPGAGPAWTDPEFLKRGQTLDRTPPRLYLAAATSVVLAAGAIITGTCAAQ